MPLLNVYAISWIGSAVLSQFHNLSFTITLFRVVIYLSNRFGRSNRHCETGNNESSQVGDGLGAFFGLPSSYPVEKLKPPFGDPWLRVKRKTGPIGERPEENAGVK